MGRPIAPAAGYVALMQLAPAFFVVCSFVNLSQAVSTTLHLTVDSITGLPRAVITQTESAAAGGGGSGGVGRSTAGSSTPSRVALVLVDTTTQ